MHQRDLATVVAAFIVIGATGCSGRLFEPVADDSRCSAIEELACRTVEAPVAADDLIVGIAGVAASRTDFAITADCFPCAFTTVDLDIFETAQLLTDPAEASEVVAGTPLSLVINERYERDLSPGTYLLCAGDECAAVEVFDGSVTTANVLISGLATIFTFGPDGTPGPASFRVARPE